MVFYFKDRYINLLTDFGFKRVFGTEANKQFTIDFLNTLLPEHHHIQDLTQGYFILKTPMSVSNDCPHRR